MYRFLRPFYLTLPYKLRKILEDIWSRPIGKIGAAAIPLFLLYSLISFENEPTVDYSKTTGTAGQALIGETLVGVPYIVDGDSLVIDDIIIHLDGVDAFEINQTCRLADRREVECGTWSTTTLKDNIDGTTLSCLVTGIDEHHNAVAICSNDEYDDIGAQMVYHGFAMAYYPHKDHTQNYIALQDAAELADAGAWEGFFMQPWYTRITGQID